MIPPLTVNYTTFIDVIILCVIAITAVVVILIPYFNPPTKEEQLAIEAPGDLMFEASWEPRIPVDIDMWVKSPKGKAVGYANKNSGTLNYLRDDMGNINDKTVVNQELIITRGLQAGEYIVNMHFYNDHRKIGAPRLQYYVPIAPVPVYVRVIKKNKDGTSTVWLEKEVILSSIKEQITVFRFIVDLEGKILRNTVNNEFISIITVEDTRH